MITSVKASRVLVIALVFLLLIPPSLGHTSDHTSYTITEEGTYISVPKIGDVGNLTGLFITHGVTYSTASINTPYGNLIIFYGKASRNWKHSYGFSFVINNVTRTGNVTARIVSIYQEVVEDRGTYTSTLHQLYYYNDTADQYVRSPSDLRTIRVRTGNFTFFMDMVLNPGQVVGPTSITKTYLLVPFYIISPDTQSVHVELTITLSVMGSTYNIKFTADPEFVDTSYEVYLGNQKTNEANVTVGERVLFRILIYNPPAMTLALADEYASIRNFSLPNMRYPIPINASYPKPPPIGAAGSLVGRPLTHQAVYNLENHEMALALPITTQVEKESFKIYVFFPIAYRVYIDPVTFATTTGVVRNYLVLTLHSESNYERGLNPIAIAFVVILAIIVLITLRIVIRTIRA